MRTSDLRAFTELAALEIRGIEDRFKVIMDAPLDGLYFANLEAVELAGDPKSARRPHTSHVDPAESFTYTPTIEGKANAYNVTVEIAEPDDGVDVVPYEVYLVELARAKMPTFYGWSKLHILRLHNCRLDQLHWQIFDGLSQLQILSLDHNRIKILPHFAFYGTPSLRRLSLSNNEILNLNYRDLAGLLQLKSLDLSHNNLTKLSEMTFPPFPQLEWLDLRHNSITHIFAYTFDVMNQTRVLHLGTPTLAIDLTQSDHAFDSLHELRRLTVVNGTHPRLNDKLFRGLVRLEVLQMRGGHFPELAFDAFGAVASVRELYASHCGIETLSMDTFYSNEALEIVDLAHNRLAYLPPHIFDSQTRLRELYLQQNALTQLPASFFRSLPSAVKVVRLTQNPFVCSCEMMAWKQAVTNNRAVRRTIKQCKPIVNDSAFHGNHSDHCTEKVVHHYVYDNKLSPRCDGGPDAVKHKSVYYALRRDLNCKRKLPLETEEKAAPAKPTKIIQGKPMTMTELLLRQRQAERKAYRYMNEIGYQQPAHRLAGKRRPSMPVLKWTKKTVPYFTEEDNQLSNQLI